jgi:hypothetical protein
MAPRGNLNHSRAAGEEATLGGTARDTTTIPVRTSQKTYIPLIEEIMTERTPEYRLVVTKVVAAFLEVMNEPGLKEIAKDETIFWFSQLSAGDIERAYTELSLNPEG